MSTAVTMHVVIDDIISRTGLDLITIPKAVSSEALSRGYKKIGLLGTIFTMEKDYMKKDFIDSGIDVIVPGKEDRELVAKSILADCATASVASLPSPISRKSGARSGEANSCCETRSMNMQTPSLFMRQQGAQAPRATPL